MTDWRIVQAQVRARSKDGKDAYSEEFKQGGFKPKTTAYVVMSSWSFEFTFGDHNLYQIGLYLQHAQAGGGGWAYGDGVPVQEDGTIWCRYRGFVGSENMDNPFTFLVNYTVIGEKA